MSILAEMFGGSPTKNNARQRLLDMVLPQDCLLCRAPSASALLCTDCAGELPRLPQPACPRCALPSPQGEICGRCQRHPPHFDRLIALYPYRFPLDRMIQHLKYGHQLALAAWFGQEIAHACANESFDRIVPMPLHPSRMAERGFNQAMEICRPLAQFQKTVDRQRLLRTDSADHSARGADATGTTAQYEECLCLQPRPQRPACPARR
jgi:predicted amidophosphoribosyltransferase